MTEKYINGNIISRGYGDKKMMLKEHIEKELGGTWEEKLKKSREELNGMLSELLLIWEEELKKSSPNNKKNMLYRNHCIRYSINRESGFPAHRDVVLNISEDEKTVNVNFRKTTDSIISILDSSEALSNYTAEVMLRKIHAYMMIVQSAQFYPSGIGKNGPRPWHFNVASHRFGIDKSVDKTKISPEKHPSYKYFTENFESAEAFRQFLYEKAGIEFIPLKEIQKAKDQFNNGQISNSEFISLQYQSYISPVYCYDWMYGFSGNLPEFSYNRYVSKEFMPKPINSLSYSYVKDSSNN